MSFLDELIKEHGIDKLNHVTLYPMIPSYHLKGYSTGPLEKSLSENRNFSACRNCYITGQLDGVHMRIIMVKGDYIIGNRERLIYSKDDRIMCVDTKMVSALKSIAEPLCWKYYCGENDINVVYGELCYRYDNNGEAEYIFNVFDRLTIYGGELRIFKLDDDEITAWISGGHQSFVTTDSLAKYVSECDLTPVPHLANIDGVNIPTDIMDTYEFLKRFSSPRIDYVNNVSGIVIRTPNREMIRSLRFNDYKRIADGDVPPGLIR